MEEEWFRGDQELDLKELSSWRLVDVKEQALGWLNTYQSGAQWRGRAEVSIWGPLASR